MKNRRKNLLIIAILFLTVGFATVATNLIINGKLLIGSNDDFVVIFTSAKLNGAKRNDFISSDKKTIDFTTNTLTTLEDEAVLEFEVTNTSRNYDANVEITCNPTEHEYVNLNLPDDMTVSAGSTETGRITASLKKATSENQSIEINCTLTATAEGRTELGENYAAPFSKAGTLKAVDYEMDRLGPETYGEFWSYSSEITKVVFEPKMAPHDTNEDLIFDVSKSQDESVMAYLVFPYSSLSDEEKQVKFEEYIQEEYGMNLDELYSYIMAEGTTAGEAYNRIDQMKEDLFNSCILYIQSETGVKANEDSSYLFYKFYYLKEIDGLEYFDTSYVTDMNAMFAGCNSLTKLNIGSWNTSNVTDMSKMFSGCNSLTELNIGSWQTSNVTDMRNMFSGCSSLKGLNISTWDTGKVTNMSFMFFECSSLAKLNISSWNTSNVTNMGYMFSECSSLTDLYLGRIDINDNALPGGMFNNTSSTIKIHIKDNATKDWIMKSNFSFTEDNFILEA